MLIWLETYVKTHLFYLVLIVGALFGAHVWLQEHDARVKAEAVIKEQQAAVVNLQQQITANNAQAAAQVKTVVKVVHDVTTPAQVVQAVPVLTPAPLNPRVATDNPSQVSVDALPLVAVLGQAREDAINLTACKADLTAETAIVDAKQKEVTALLKKPNFFKRVAGVAKAVGVGVGIGLLLSGHL